jgi:ArsR family transcriptional regulator
VDAAVCVLLLHHLENPESALAEMRRVLRRDRGGGKVLVVDMVSHGREEYRRLMGHKHLGFSKDEMTGLLARAGLTDTWYQELPSEPSAKGPGLFVATGTI